ncbi:MAG: hypothetical protein U9R74_08785 [Pseudomonadota bacterium]|nr:hypothetical protein [Pseudomonadota bacterium]
MICVAEVPVIVVAVDGPVDRVNFKSATTRLARFTPANGVDPHPVKPRQWIS